MCDLAPSQNIRLSYSVNHHEESNFSKERKEKKKPGRKLSLLLLFHAMFTQYSSVKLIWWSI